MSFALIFSRRICLWVACVLLATTPVYPEQTAVQKNFDGLPNIPARPKNARENWVVSADFLAWFSSEEVDAIWADVITIGDNTSTWSAPSFKFPWDYGFRIGTGYGCTYDAWDTALYWTWFRTDAHHTIAFNPSATIVPEFFAAWLTKDTPRSMSAKWSLLFNMFDLELGRKYWVSRGLSLRPFLGLKGGWIHQSIQAYYDNLIIGGTPTDNSASEQLKNNFWGLGPVGGINTEWRVRDFDSHFFYLFGDFSLATLWGTWTCADRYQNTAGRTFAVKTKNAALGALMFRGFMGWGWSVDFREDKSRFSAKIGYEMQFWLNQLRLATFQLQRLQGDLTLQGVTLNCEFDF